MEEWRDISGYEGSYQVSNLGRVKSLSRVVLGVKRNKEPIARIKTERFLKESINPDGYAFVKLCNRSILKIKYIHKLVASTFLGDNSECCVDHKNNIKGDNRLENLQYISPRENLTKDRSGSSKYSGVCLHRASNKWEAYVKYDKTKKYLGLFRTEEEASNAYQKALVEYGIDNRYSKVA